MCCARRLLSSTAQGSRHNRCSAYDAYITLRKSPFRDGDRAPTLTARTDQQAHRPGLFKLPHFIHRPVRLSSYRAAKVVIDLMSFNQPGYRPFSCRASCYTCKPLIVEQQGWIPLSIRQQKGPRLYLRERSAPWGRVFLRNLSLRLRTMTWMTVL